MAMRSTLKSRLARLEAARSVGQETVPFVLLCLYQDEVPDCQLVGLRGGRNHDAEIMLQPGETFEQLQDRAKREVPTGSVFLGLYTNFSGLVTPLGVDEDEWQAQSHRHHVEMFAREDRLLMPTPSIPVRDWEPH